MHLKAPQTAPQGVFPPSGLDNLPDALKRPQGLKKWSSDLVKIVHKEEDSIFEGWDFRPGDLTRHDFTRILRKMTGCGSVVELRAKVDRGTGEMTAPALHAANFCGQHTICPYCAGRVQDRRKARYRDAIRGAARTYRHAYLVTATIPPVPSWREDLDLLLDSWKSFRKMGQKRKGRAAGTSSGEWSKIRAGLAKVEIKRGQDSGLPHCHIHALFFTDEHFDFRVWSPEEKAKARAERKSLNKNNASKIALEWQAATDGRATGINVKKIKWRPAKRAKDEALQAFRARSENWSFEDSVYEQAREVLKYATKFESAPAAGSETLFARDFVGIKSATYGRRLFHTYGAFRKVAGDDFTGSDCPLSSNPIIFESRWRRDRYSPLIQRSRPLFQNCDPGPHLTKRLQVLNRVQGATRRIRRAINESKRHYLNSGALVPALFTRRTYLDEGGFTEIPVVLEMPAEVLSRPDDLDTWERWVDSATEAGRAAYVAAREGLDMESHFRISETPEEEAGRMEIERRAWWASPEYEADLIRQFQETLARSSGPPWH